MAGNGAGINGLDANCTHVSHLYPLEVVGRGSETQLQGGNISMV